MTDTISLLKTVRTGTMEASLRSDGVIQFVVPANTYVKLPGVVEAIEAIRECGSGKRYPLLIIAGKDATMDTAAMSYMAKKTAETSTIALACHIESISQKLLGNFYLKFNKPVKPTRIFTKMEDALEWLYPYRPH